MVRRRLRWIVAAAAALALLGAGLAVPSPANAAITRYSDGFEGNAHIQWSSVEVRGKSLVFLNNIIERRSGDNAAWLHGGSNANEAARIYRRIRLEAPAGSQVCFASLYMKAGGIRTPQPATVTVLLRPTSISEPSWWTNVFTVTDASAYQFFSLGYIPYSSQFFIDISSVGEVLIDDIFFQCDRPIG